MLGLAAEALLHRIGRDEAVVLYEPSALETGHFGSAQKRLN